MEGPLCRADTRLIETFGWDGGAFHRIDAHLARARASAIALGFSWNPQAIDAALCTVGSDDTAPAPRRIRLTIGRKGDAEITSMPLPPNPSEWRLILSADRLDPDAPLLRYKTTERHLYDATRAALPDGVDEVLFCNLRGELAEGTITNIFADFGDGLVTPPLASGCLPGILRAELLDQGRAHEQVIDVQDLADARLFVGNALRGLIPARLVSAH